MSFLVGILTVLMVFNCAVLILLILIQLPKKDAGAGLAFGGGTADALFGAGSGNALTKITKWAAGIFFALALLLAFMEDKLQNKDSSAFEKQVQQNQMKQTPMLPPPASSVPAAMPTNGPLTIPMAMATNKSAAPVQSK